MLPYKSQRLNSLMPWGCMRMDTGSPWLCVSRGYLHGNGDYWVRIPVSQGIGRIYGIWRLSQFAFMTGFTPKIASFRMPEVRSIRCMDFGPFLHLCPAPRLLRWIDCPRMA